MDGAAAAPAGCAAHRCGTSTRSPSGSAACSPTAEYRRAYEGARRRYVRETRRLFGALAELPGIKAFPSAANFALLELDRPAAEVATALLVRHGVYVRDCGDKWGLDGGRFMRVAARRASENRHIHAALAEVLSEPQAVSARHEAHGRRRVESRLTHAHARRSPLKEVSDVRPAVHL